MWQNLGVDKRWVESVILSDDRSRRIVKCSEVRESPLTSKGKNATCEMSRLTVTVELGSGAAADLTFVAKKIPDSEGMRTFLKEFGMFEGEIRTYGILNQMEGLMSSSGDFRDTLWCQLKGYSDGVIILEDLNAKGYEPLNSLEMVDEERSIFVIRELARFHALGRVLLEKGLVDPSTIPSLSHMAEKSHKMFHSVAMKALRTSVQNWGPEWSDTVNQLDQIIDNLRRIIGRLWEMNESTMKVISHGDFWKGNVMLKSDISGHPSALKFVDFQTSTLATYAYDLCLFLYTSVEHELRWNKIDQLLKAYCDSLLINMRYYKLTVSEAPTLSTVKNDVENLRVVCIILMTIYWPIVSNESEHRVSDGFESRNAGEEENEIFRPAMYASEKSKKILGRELKALIGRQLF